jgi:NADH:ubiquinone oxidoreductase subunit B-like Fe-S oxidoreductase
MARRLLVMYEQMLSPKYVIAVGACNVSGGLYWDSYNTIEGIDRVIPVDAYIPGCPPRPEQFIDAVRVLQKVIRESKVGDNRYRNGSINHVSEIKPSIIPPAAQGPSVTPIVKT